MKQVYIAIYIYNSLYGLEFQGPAFSLDFLATEITAVVLVQLCSGPFGFNGQYKKVKSNRPKSTNKNTIRDLLGCVCIMVVPIFDWLANNEATIYFVITQFFGLIKLWHNGAVHK